MQPTNDRTPLSKSTWYFPVVCLFVFISGYYDKILELDTAWSHLATHNHSARHRPTQPFKLSHSSDLPSVLFHCQLHCTFVFHIVYPSPPFSRLPFLPMSLCSSVSNLLVTPWPFPFAFCIYMFFPMTLSKRGTQRAPQKDESVALCGVFVILFKKARVGWSLIQASLPCIFRAAVCDPSQPRLVLNELKPHAAWRSCRLSL